jgi:hypothetical protein
MAQVLNPIATLLDRGIGVPDIAAVAIAATDTELQFANDGNLLLFIDNNDAGVRVATLQATPDPFGRGGGGVNNVVLNIPAGEKGFFPFANPAMFNNVGITTVVLDAFANTNVALYRLVKRS